VSYNIPPFIGSILLVLASPDTEVVPWNLPVEKILRRLLLHEHLIESGQIKSVEHHLRFNKTYPNHSSRALLLSRTLGTQSRWLWPQAGESDVRAIDQVQIYVLLINYISYNLKFEDSINFIEVSLEGVSGWLLGTAVGLGVPPPSVHGRGNGNPCISAGHGLIRINGRFRIL
jgi:hypothetical protein